MTEKPRVDILDFKIEDIEHVKAGNDFEAHTRPYHETINAKLKLFVNGKETELSSKYDLVDTARANYEMVEELEENGIYQDTPFCDVNGYRESAVIEWKITETEKGEFNLVMEDNMGRKIGNSSYKVSLSVLEKVATNLLDAVIEFMESKKYS